MKQSNTTHGCAGSIREEEWKIERERAREKREKERKRERGRISPTSSFKVRSF
jgi:hypothetical protein